MTFRMLLKHGLHPNLHHHFQQISIVSVLEFRHKVLEHTNFVVFTISKVLPQRETKRNF